MSYRKKTLRRLPPTARRYARLVNEAEGLARKLKNLTEEIARLELDSRALFARKNTTERRHKTMPNNGSRYHAEIKVDIEGRDARINVFGDTLNEIFRDLGIIAAQLPASWMRPARGEILNAGRKAASLEGSQPMAANGSPLPAPDAPSSGPRVVMPTESPPFCDHCGSCDNMQLIEFTSKKDGKLRRAWKCQECEQWHYPNRKK